MPATYRAFFQRANEPLKIMSMLLRSGRPASEAMPILAEKNELLRKALQSARPDQPCPCGSGLPVQMCHAWKYPDHDRRGRSKIAGQPRPPVRKTIINNDRHLLTR